MPVYDIPAKLVYELGGGLNQGLPAAEIAQNESPLLVNFFTLGKKNIRRGGIRRITSTPHTDTLVSIFPFKLSTGEWTLIVGSIGGFGKLSGTGILSIPTVSSLAITPVDLPWSMFQYNNVAYATRKGDGRLLHVTPDLVQLAGIPAPTTAPSIAQGAAGALAAGDYATVYTYANSDTGAESNPSPKSNVLTLGSLFKIDHSAISVSTSQQVNSRRIYRTLIDQVNEYFYVGTIPNNIDTTFTGEEVLPEDMGDPVLFDNNLPPSFLRWVTSWNERAFGTDGTTVFYTNLFNMEGWTGVDIAVYKDDGHEIRVLCPFGDRLIIGKTNKVHFLTGTDRSTFRVFTLSDKHGCMAGHSMKTAEGLLFWFGSGKNFYRSDGNNTVGIGDIKVRKLLDTIPDALQEQIVAEVYPTLSQYVVSIPMSPDPDVPTVYYKGSSTPYGLDAIAAACNRIVLVYNYRTDSWATYRHPWEAPSYLAEFFDASYGRALYGTSYDGHVYHFYDRTYNKDDAHYRYYEEGVGQFLADSLPAPIVAEMLTRQEDGGSLMQKGLRRVHLLCPTLAETITLSAYRDGRSVPSAFRDISLNVDSAWKAVNLSTLRDLGSTVQLGLLYTGTTELELEALGLELELVERFGGQPQ